MRGGGRRRKADRGKSLLIKNSNVQEPLLVAGREIKKERISSTESQSIRMLHMQPLGGLKKKRKICFENNRARNQVPGSRYFDFLGGELKRNEVRVIRGFERWRK